MYALTKRISTSNLLRKYGVRNGFFTPPERESESEIQLRPNLD